MDILDDMGVSKLSAKVNYSFKIKVFLVHRSHAMKEPFWGQKTFQ